MNAMRDFVIALSESIKRHPWFVFVGIVVSFGGALLSLPNKAQKAHDAVFCGGAPTTKQEMQQLAAGGTAEQLAAAVGKCGEVVASLVGGGNLLHVAAAAGNESAVRFFLAHKLSPDARALYETINGVTPLMLAAKNKHIEVLEELLKIGASTIAVDEKGRTAMYWAVQNEDNAAISALARAGGADGPGQGKNAGLVVAARDRKAAAVAALFAPGASASVNDSEGNSLLHVAVQSGNAETVKLVLEKDPNIARKDGSGRLPYDIARSESIRALLTEHRAALTAAAFEAARTNKVGELESSAASGADLSAQLGNGETILHAAAEKSAVDAIVWLTKVPGVEVNRQDSGGYTALAWALAQTNVCGNFAPELQRIVDALLQAGADPMIAGRQRGDVLELALNPSCPAGILGRILSRAELNSDYRRRRVENLFVDALRQYPYTKTHLEVMVEQFPFLLRTRIGNKGPVAFVKDQVSASERDAVVAFLLARGAD